MKISPAVFAALFGTLSSLLLFGISNSLNSDSIVYMHTADVFHMSGWDAAEKVYPRPFYSAVIAVVASATFLSTSVAAQVVSAFLVGLTAFSFVHLLSSLRADVRTLWVGAVLISVYPGIAGYKDYIVRDFGYWGFSLLMLSFYCRHLSGHKLRYLLGWIICGAIATLFRPEAIVLIAILPVVAFFQTGLASNQKRVYSQYLTMLVVGLMLVSVASISLDVEFWDDFYRLAIYIPEATITDLGASWRDASDRLQQHVLNRHSREFGDLSLLSMYTAIYISQVISGLSVVIALFALYLALSGKLVFPYPKFIAAVTLAIASVTVVFLISKQFVQTRYLMMLCLVLLIPITFSVAEYWKVSSPKARKVLFAFAGVLFIDAHFSFGHSKAYIPESIDWLKENTPNTAWVLSNDPQVTYLSGRKYRYNEINEFRGSKAYPPEAIPSGYQFLALKVRKLEEALEVVSLSGHDYALQERFSNSRGDAVLIYKIKDQ